MTDPDDMLWRAVDADDPERVARAIRRGANPYISSARPGQLSPWEQIIQAGQVACARAVMEAGRFSPDAVTAGGRGLHLAVRAGMPGMVELLILFGANVNIQTMLGDTPLAAAMSLLASPKPGTSRATYRRIARALEAAGGLAEYGSGK